MIDRDDIVTGCVSMLRTRPEVAAAVGVDSFGDPLIVQDNAPERAELAGQVCVVVSLLGYLFNGDRGTFQQARLQVEYWSDGARDDDGVLVEPALGRRRMIAAYGVIDRILHRANAGREVWGTIATTDSARQAALTPYEVPNADGLWRGTAIYAVGLA